MQMRMLLPALGLLFVASCGISKEEHDQLVQKAMDEQKAEYDAKMKKMQAASDDDAAKKKEVIESKDQMIKGLESEVKKLGGDLARVRADLGDRVADLAATKTDLAATTAELEQLRKLRAEAEKEAAQFRAIAQKLKSMVDAGQLEVVMRKGRINLKLPDNILFPSGSDKLKKDGKEAIKSVADVLKEVTDREFLIAGHTDNVPLGRKGRFKNNWALSTARAVEVVDLMIEFGVSGDQLAAAGFGEFDPIADNETEEGRQKNRRLEIILLPKIEQVAL